MGFLSFIKNRSDQQPSAESKPQPETAKQMYSRETAQDRATAKPVNELRPEDGAKLKQAQELYSRGTQAIDNSPAITPPPSGGATSPQPQMQMSMNQNQAAPDMSPTSAQKGTPSREKESPSVSPDTASKSQDAQRQTIARRPPSWER